MDYKPFLEGFKEGIQKAAYQDDPDYGWYKPWTWDFFRHPLRGQWYNPNSLDFWGGGLTGTEGSTGSPVGIADQIAMFTPTLPTQIYTWGKMLGDMFVSPKLTEYWKNKNIQEQMTQDLPNVQEGIKNQAKALANNLGISVQEALGRIQQGQEYQQMKQQLTHGIPELGITRQTPAGAETGATPQQATQILEQVGATNPQVEQPWLQKYGPWIAGGGLGLGALALAKSLFSNPERPRRRKTVYGRQ